MTDIVERLKVSATYCTAKGMYSEAESIYAAIDEIHRTDAKMANLRRALHIIGNDYVELSHDKVHWQRDDHMKTARKALEESYSATNK